MDIKKYDIIENPDYGYKHLDPVPQEKELTNFYQSQYYDLIRKGGRAPELRRLMEGGKEGELEREWLSNILYSDICFVLNQHASGKRVLEVGCGTGEFLSYMKENGFDTVGIEPSSDAMAIAESKGIMVHNSTFEEFIKYYISNNIDSFDAVTFLNVLEHVPNPVQIVEITKTILKPGGIICIRVPNDFSEIQLAAQKQLDIKPWWIAAPDHINYFNFKSLNYFLERLGFKVIYSQGDFPMELFLLMGENYVGNPDLGSKCHRKRVNFEMSIPSDLRHRIYRSLAEIGLGRDCLVFGRLKE